MKTAILSITFAVLLNYANGQSCKQLAEDSDECLRKILYIGDNNMVFVTTQKMLDEHCKEIKASYKCLMRYGKCLKQFPKQVFTLTMRSTKKIIKERCDTRAGRKEFLKHTKCLRKPEVYDFNRCVDKGVLNMKFLALNASDNELLPSLCCAIQDVAACLKMKGDEYCLNYTRTQTGDYVSGITLKVSKDLIELACGERNSFPKCQKLEPKWMKYFDVLAHPFSDIKPQKESYIRPLLSLAARLTAPL